MSVNWFRVPPWVATAPPGEKATKAGATIDLLKRWHLGEYPNLRTLMRDWDWSGDRVEKLAKEVWLWAIENGAQRPPQHLPGNRTKSDTSRTGIGQRSDSGRTGGASSNADNQEAVGQQSDTDRTAVGQPSDTSRARIPLETDEDGRRETDGKPIHVPPVPVDTLPLPAPEPAPCAPPPAIPTSAQESTAKAATNTQPGLWPVATADTAASPKKPKKAAAKADNDEAVMQVWACYRVHHPRSGEKPPGADAKLIRTALADWTAEQLCKVIDWAHTSGHQRAVYLRENGYIGVSNLLVGANIGIRLELADLETPPGTDPRGAVAPALPQEDPATIWESLIKRRSGGVKVLPEDIPPRTVAAIRAVGGWNQLGMLNDFTERQAKASFIAAYRNYTPVNGHQRTA